MLRDHLGCLRDAAGEVEAVIAAGERTRGGWRVGRRRDGAVLRANVEQRSLAGGLSAMPPSGRCASLLWHR